MEIQYASNGKGNLGVTLGAIGTGLAVLGGQNGNLLGGLMGGGYSRYDAEKDARIAQLMGLTKLVVPNASICPGWGNVTVTPAAAPTTGG